MTLSHISSACWIRHPFAVARRRMGRWMLVLAVIWQAMIGLMPIAQAKVAAGDGQWETICTMQGAAKIWFTSDASVDSSSEPVQASDESYCPLCVMSQSGMAPPPVSPMGESLVLPHQIGQVPFTAVYLTRAWSEPATGPPSLH